jgi:glutamyl-Q tRNA(Asp) synthetase
MGLLYPCFCSRKEIQHELTQLSDAPHGPEGPLYPATCRNLSGKNRKKLLENSEPAWRLDSLKAANLVGKLTFEDTLHGKIKVDPLLLGDLILSRRDIGTSYHLAVVIDDAAQEIDLVTRGEDLLGSTHLHRVLQALLNLPQPHYEHHRLIVDDRGRRLAKRDKSTSLRHLRDTGWTPEEVMASFGC